MGSAPKIPDPAPPPAPPPPPTEVAEKVKKPTARRAEASKRRGTSALTIRRPSVNVGGGRAAGANLPY
jgi:hypothetical protein